ncbi:transcriptional regulator, AraC family protein [Rhodoferax antarcticus ANT.BR]|uniref:Transcriptional regulator, AraC family protein n=1 Tax=Rhodoferax antarcticus ANT.BR TaxID=1111071 RepID=A0A1Q8YCI3_9BURK|nr:transcriptional regulator, AraC family protein [Rhodoferax antarcticus ANT.BR]
MHVLTWHRGIEMLDVCIKGESFGKHSHDAFAIGMIEGGVGGNFVRGSKEVLPACTVSLMNPDEPHTGYAVTKSLKYKMLYVSEDELREMLDHQPIKGFQNCVAHDVDGKIRKLFDALAYALSRPKNSGWKISVDTQLTLTLETLMTRYAGLSVRKAGQEVAAVQRVKDYLDSLANSIALSPFELNSKAVSLGDLAKMVGLQPNYLVNVFRAKVGISPYAYWTVRRMASAKAMLLRGISPLDVMFKLGFYDQAHFIKAFKRTTGITPKQILGH